MHKITAMRSKDTIANRSHLFSVTNQVNSFPHKSRLAITSSSLSPCLISAQYTRGCSVHQGDIRAEMVGDIMSTLAVFNTPGGYHN